MNAHDPLTDAQLTKANKALRRAGYNVYRGDVYQPRTIADIIIDVCGPLAGTNEYAEVGALIAAALLTRQPPA